MTFHSAGTPRSKSRQSLFLQLAFDEIPETMQMESFSRRKPSRVAHVQPLGVAPHWQRQHLHRTSPRILIRTQTRRTTETHCPRLIRWVVSKEAVVDFQNLDSVPIETTERLNNAQQLLRVLNRYQEWALDRCRHKKWSVDLGFTARTSGKPNLGAAAPADCAMARQ